MGPRKKTQTRKPTTRRSIFRNPRDARLPEMLNVNVLQKEMDNITQWNQCTGSDPEFKRVFIDHVLRFLPRDVDDNLRNKVMVILEPDCGAEGAHLNRKDIKTRSVIFVQLSRDYLDQLELPHNRTWSRIRSLATQGNLPLNFVYPILHELAHAALDHRSPALSDVTPEQKMDDEVRAKELALRWIQDHDPKMLQNN